MGVSPLIAIVAVGVFFIAVSLIWWLRYQEKKTVARNVSRRPHPYVGGRMANNIYRIPLSRNYIYQTPPPTFSKAVKYPVPTNKNRVSVINVYLPEEAPPPTYEQYVKAQQMPGSNPPLIVIVILACAFVSLLIGIIIYCYRRNLRNMCGRAFHRKKRVHEITAPVRPSGENDIVLAVTQRRDPPHRSNHPLTHGTALRRHHTDVGAGTYQRHIQRPPPPYFVNRHQSFSLYNSGGNIRRAQLGFGTDLPSPFVSNLSSLQSLLMSSQIAIFDSSTERLSLSSQNNNHILAQHQQQPITIPLRQLQLQQHANGGGASLGLGQRVSSTSPLTVSPAASSFSVHLPQPSYFDERPPSYHESIQKLRASDRGVGSNSRITAGDNTSNGIDLSRRSCRM